MADVKQCTGVERTFAPDQIIVSKTDAGGRITYANDTLLAISGYGEDELLGKPHNIIRHPQMPRVVFKLLWERIQAGSEAFAYVINRCKNGDHYWVFAHVTPNYDSAGAIIGYHSCRRVPKPSVIEIIEPFYAQLHQVEAQADRKAGLIQSEAMVDKLYRSYGLDSYDHFIITFGR